MNQTTPRAQLQPEADITQLLAQLELATVQNATLAAENRRLRKLTRNGKSGRILHRAAADARQIVGWRFSGFSVTRAACEGYGMPRRRWIWAVGLLRVASIVDVGRGPIDEFLIEDLTQCLAALDRATARMERDGIVSMILRMPRGAAVFPKRAR